LERLEDISGKKITILDRADVEERFEETMLEAAKKKNVALLVSGDPLVATTHVDLLLRAKRKGIQTRVIHSSSIYSAIAETGLMLYKFGKTTTLALPEPGYAPTSPYDAIKENKSRGLHTLVLLDVKSDRRKYMSVGDGIEELLRLEAEKEGGLFDEDTMLVAACRLGADDSVIRYAKTRELAKDDFGGPPHTLIVPGELHYMEEEALDRFLTRSS